MSTVYVRSTDFVLFAASNRSAKMNVELDLISASIATLLVNPAFSGNATAVTQSVGNNTTLIATTAFVQAAIGAAGTMLPVQTGHAGEWGYTDGTSMSWRPLPQQTYAIFSASTVTLKAVSTLESLENSIADTGLGTSGITQIINGNSLFVAAEGPSAFGSVSTSPDGLTWTLRAMPSNSGWMIGTDGTSFVATITAATGVAFSAGGTSWALTSALPGAAKATYGLPVFVSATVCFVLSNTAATAYTSANYGTSWTSQTLPANAGNMAPFVVGGLIWYWNAGTTAYTSATGATGTFTSRMLPATPNNVWQDYDGALWLTATGGSAYYRTTDGINWTTLAIPSPLPSINNTVIRTINGVYSFASTTFGEAVSMHNSVWVRRTAAGLDSPVSYYRCAKNGGGTVFLYPHNGAIGRVGRIAPAEGSAATAVFTS